MFKLIRKYKPTFMFIAKSLTICLQKKTRVLRCRGFGKIFNLFLIGSLTDFKGTWSGDSPRNFLWKMVQLMQDKNYATHCFGTKLIRGWEGLRRLTYWDKITRYFACISNTDFITAYVFNINIPVRISSCSNLHSKECYPCIALNQLGKTKLWYVSV